MFPFIVRYLSGFSAWCLVGNKQTFFVTKPLPEGMKKAENSTAAQVEFKITIKSAEKLSKPTGKLRVGWKKSKNEGKVTNNSSQFSENLDQECDSCQRWYSHLGWNLHVCV